MNKFFFLPIYSARYAYENCIYNSAKHKCKPESAEFTRKIAELLSSERKFKNCDNLEDAAVCSGGSKIISTYLCSAILIFLFALSNLHVVR